MSGWQQQWTRNTNALLTLLTDFSDEYISIDPFTVVNKISSVCIFNKTSADHVTLLFILSLLFL